MRVNMRGDGTLVVTKKGLLGREKVEKHNFVVELMLNDKTMEVEGALVVDTETDAQWQLIAAQLLRR